MGVNDSISFKYSMDVNDSISFMGILVLSILWVVNDSISFKYSMGVNDSINFKYSACINTHGC